MTISSQDINSIVDALQRSNWDEAVVVVGDTKIAVARNGARLSAGEVGGAVTSAPAAAASPAPVAAASASAPTAASPAPVAAVPAPVGQADSSDTNITAPSVGTFWRAPEPSAAPFVEVGAHVDADDTVAIVEIMKLMNNVRAGVSGTVTAIHVENGGAVQFGETLISVRPDSV